MNIYKYKLAKQIFSEEREGKEKEGERNEFTI